ncbi:MAG: SLC13 family permease, partial [Candidatus Thorarchaeota archaeon]
GLTIEGIIIIMIFAATLLILLFDKFDATATALLALCMSSAVVFFSPNYNESFTSFVGNISWDTVLFVAAMMIVVSVASSSGMFQYVALILAKRSRGNPLSLLWMFTIFVFVISLFLDPLPTMIVMAPFTVEICRAINVDPRPVLTAEIVVAVFASFPSVVGAVPNMVVVLTAKVDAGLMFITNLPLSVTLYAVTMPLLIRHYRADLVHAANYDATLLMMLEPAQMIKSRRDFYLSAVCMAILLTGFVIQLEPSLVALVVASMMLVLTHRNAKKLLRQLSWDTVFFLVGLFGVITALNTTGIVETLVTGVSTLVGDNPYIAVLFMLWIPGVGFSMVDNVPLAALLAPLAEKFKLINLLVPYSLIVGTNIGVYLVPIGDASIIVAVNETRRAGRPLRLLDLARFATPLGFLHLTMTTLYFFLALTAGLIFCVIVMAISLFVIKRQLATIGLRNGGPEETSSSRTGRWRRSIR